MNEEANDTCSDFGAHLRNLLPYLRAVVDAVVNQPHGANFCNLKGLGRNESAGLERIKPLQMEPLVALTRPGCVLHRLQKRTSEKSPGA